MANQEIYEKITNQIISELEKGKIPWLKPWKCSWPANLKTGKSYKGVNVLLLSIKNYTSRYWATYNQIKGLGGRVKRGEKSTQIVFWNVYEKEEDERKFFFLRTYNVFNADQCVGLEHARLDEEKENQDKPTHQKIKDCDSIFDKWTNKPSLSTAGDVACYSPLADQIKMPHLSKFDNAEGYYSTLFHEATHSTGHKSRLDREGVQGTSFFGSVTYSKEELIAEFGAAFLCGITGIQNSATSKNNAAYIQSWLKVFKNDPKIALQAASAAQKAVEFITE